MTLGVAFLNVFGEPGGSDDDLLRQALVGRTDTSPPCTFWISRVARLAVSRVIPSSVTLAFAPSAFLIIENHVLVRGPLDAGLAPRFALVGGGRVDLLGALEEIVADWWLETDGVGPVERALAALWSRYREPGILPAPIRLSGPYVLERTLRIIAPTDIGPVEVMLRGEHGCPADPPTFTIAPGGAEMLSMVSVEELTTLKLESVAFDDGSVAHAQNDPVSRGVACLSVESEDYDGTSIEACSFRFDGVAVLVKPSIHRWRSRVVAGGMTPAGADLLALGDAIRLSVRQPARLLIDRCVFTGIGPATCGFFADLGTPPTLSLRNCVFTGLYANAVSLLGGELDVVACQFGSALRPVGENESGDIVTRSWDEGVNANSKGERVNGGWLERFISNQPRGFNVYRQQPLKNTHVTITHSLSTSVVFMRLNPAFLYPDTVPGGALLTGVRHAPPDGGLALHIGPRAPRRSVVLQGCRFSSGVTFDYSLTGDIVVDLGTVFPRGAGFVYLGRGIGPTVTLDDQP